MRDTLASGQHANMDLETQHQDPTSCSAMTTPQDKVEANVPPIIDDEEVRQLQLETAEVVH